MTTIVLGGVTLNPNMVWVDRFISQKVGQSLKRTLGGRPVIYSGAVGFGISITLEATEDYGWLPKSDVDQLVTFAEGVGSIFTLTFNAVNYDVVFRHNEPPALDFRPFVPRVAHVATDYFIGQIKLVTV